MHEVLRERLRRHIDALPEEQVYQVLDYIEFLSSKYARDAVRPPASSFQRFGERLEDKLRGKSVGLRAIRGTLDAVGTADRMVNGLTSAGRSILREVEGGLLGEPDPKRRATGTTSPSLPRDTPVDG
ncbi:MAG TPA: hypothetical protein VFI91_14730 [Longimicrobiaceae bacterium]|nr:hypothetical protein [Longimicrobiaceae bacterium]